MPNKITIPYIVVKEKGKKKGKAILFYNNTATAAAIIASKSARIEDAVFVLLLEEIITKQILTFKFKGYYCLWANLPILIRNLSTFQTLINTFKNS